MYGKATREACIISVHAGELGGHDRADSPERAERLYRTQKVGTVVVYMAVYVCVYMHMCVRVYECEDGIYCGSLGFIDGI